MVDYLLLNWGKYRAMLLHQILTLTWVWCLCIFEDSAQNFLIILQYSVAVKYVIKVKNDRYSINQKYSKNTERKKRKSYFK